VGSDGRTVLLTSGGRRVCRTVGALCIALAVLLPRSSVGAAPAADRLWFCPGPGTLDMQQLFSKPADWPRSRQLLNVFKFYQQHTQMPPDPIVGPNSYDALVRADAFRTLNRWGKKTAIEVGSVKDYYCTADATGMNQSIAASVASIRAIQTAGGSVTYLAQDEPFVSGRAAICGGPALEPTADRVGIYVVGVHAVFPEVRIGLIEAYPFSSADAIETILQLLKARNATPAFLHMDVDWHLSGSAPFVKDMARLKAVADASSIPFGIIITGYNGDADALYAIDVYGITELVVQTFPTWDQMPGQIIFQSWVESKNGSRITPSNLPESTLYTHTGMLWDVFRRLRGAAGPPAGKAIKGR
jgi:hypothetical protein